MISFEHRFTAFTTVISCSAFMGVDTLAWMGRLFDALRWRWDVGWSWNGVGPKMGADWKSCEVIWRLDLREMNRESIVSFGVDFFAVLVIVLRCMRANFTVIGVESEDHNIKPQASSLKIQDSRFKVQDSRFKIQDSGKCFRICGVPFS
jgi:hypothetical protein